MSVSKPSGSNTQYGLPANRILQERIGHLLIAPDWAAAERSAALLCELHLSSRKLENPRRVVAKVEWHPGELYPRVGLIVTNMSPPGRARRCFLQQARNMRAMDQGRQGRDQMDAAVMSDVRGQRRSSSASCAGLQSRQFPAHFGDAGADQGLVADEFEGEAHQDRREGRQPWALCRVPDGRGRHPTASVRRHSAAHRGTSTATRSSACVKCSVVIAFEPNSRGRCI